MCYKGVCVCVGGGVLCFYSKIFCKTVKLYRACENVLLHQQDAERGRAVRKPVTFVDRACGSF